MQTQWIWWEAQPTRSDCNLKARACRFCVSRIRNSYMLINCFLTTLTNYIKKSAICFFNEILNKRERVIWTKSKSKRALIRKKQTNIPISPYRPFLYTFKEALWVSCKNHPLRDIAFILRKVVVFSKIQKQIFNKK
jgi:hypothetical protein